MSELRERLDAELKAAGYWVDYGGTFEQLISAAQRLSVVVPLALQSSPRCSSLAFGFDAIAFAIFSGVPLA